MVAAVAQYIGAELVRLSLLETRAMRLPDQDEIKEGVIVNGDENDEWLADNLTSTLDRAFRTAVATSRYYKYGLLFVFHKLT